MSQRVVTPFVNSNIPDAYPNITVLSQPVGLGASGVVIIMGESVGGPNYQSVSLAGNSFTPDQLSKVASTYISGQIVDAFQALSSPSNDPGIVGTANLIYIIKTNHSLKASALVAAATSSPSTYGTLEDLNWGTPGNSYQYQITELAAEVAPNIQGGTVPNFPATDGAMFTVRLNGGAATVVTLGGSITNVGTLVTALNSAFTTASLAITAAPATAAPTTAIQLSVNSDANANSAGWGKALELVDTTPGDLASLGLSAGLTFSSQEPEVELQVNNSNTGLSETLNIEPAISLMVGYAGTTATMTINSSGMLTTTVTGGSGSNLSVNMSQYKTVGALATFLNSQTGYTATVSPSANQLPPSALDTVTAIGIAATQASATPGRVKNSVYAWKQQVGTSTAVEFVPLATAGLPAPMASPAFLSGGALGATSSADIVNAIAQMGGVATNIIVPLFSQDATEDAEDGLTDPSSTYTIAAINQGVKNHCIQYSTPKLKRNRICILSYWDNTENTYVNAKAQAQGLANYRCSLTMQQTMQDNSLGVITTFMPWYAAVVAAGMQTGGFYKAIVNKLANVTSVIDPAGFNNGDPGDNEDALNAGLLFLTNTTAGNSWVSDQTTYGFDTNFVYNSIQAVYTSDIIALDLASSFKSAFAGQSLADVSASTALSYLAQKMNGYKRLKLIASSDDAPLGYKNAKVSILAPEMDVSVEIKLATAIYFIPIQINISQVQQTAS